MPPKKSQKQKTAASEKKTRRKSSASKKKIIYKEGQVLAISDSSAPKGFSLAIAQNDIEENPKNDPLLAPLDLHDEKKRVYLSGTGETEFLYEDILGVVTVAEVKVKKGKKTLDGYSIEESEERRLRELAGTNEKHDSSDKSEPEEESESEEEERVIKKAKGPKTKIDTEMVTESKQESSLTVKRSKPTRSASASKSDVVKATRSSKKVQTKDGKAVVSKLDDEYSLDSELVDEKPSKKGKKKSGKSSEKYKKGKFNPNAQIITTMNQLYGKQNKPVFTPNIRNNNKEVLRAVLTKNSTLLKAILNSETQISTVCQTWAPENDIHPVLEAMKENNLELLTLLVEHIQSEKKKYASINECSLKEIDTGFNDFYAYGVRTRKVAMSRGSKEGNNAFVADMRTATDDLTQILGRMMRAGVTPKMVDYLRASVTGANFEYQMESHIGEAVRAGNYKLAGHLIAYANKKGGFGFNQLHEFALTKKTKDQMGIFKKVSATKKAMNNFSITPVHCACINPEVAPLKALLDICLEFGVMDIELRKPVHYAAACEGSGPLEYLIEKNVDTRDTDKLKISPLMIACQFGRPHNVKVLVEGERSILMSRSREGMSAVHYAAKHGSTSCLEILAASGADLNNAGPSRMTPLHLAAAYGHSETVKFLLDKGVSVIKKDKHGRSALIMAVRNGDIHSATMLMRAGSVVEGPDSSKNFPLHYACAYGFNELIDPIIQAGGSFNPTNSWNLSPLLVAMLKGNYDTVKKMLDYPETDVNCKDDEGRTLVSSATNNVSEFGLEQLKFLVEEKKANVNIPDLKGMTPLHYICQQKPKQLCNKHIQNFSKLPLSEQKDHIEAYDKLLQSFVKVLVSNGGDVNVASEDGRTPLTIVLSRRNNSLISLLLGTPSLNLHLSTKIGTNIYHDLHTLAMKKNFLNFFNTIHEKVGRGNEHMLNQVDDQGFTPVLRIMHSFGKVARGTWGSLNNKITARRLERKIREVKEEKNGSGMIIEKETSGLRMGARVKQTNRKAFAISSLIEDSDGKSHKVVLTEEEQRQCSDQLEVEFRKRLEEVVAVLKGLAENGANLLKTVEKLKEHRGKEDDTEMKDRIAPETTQDDSDDSPMAGGLFGARKMQVRTRPARMFWKPVVTDDEDKKKKVIPYGPEGEQSILHLMMRSPYLLVLESIMGIPGININQKDYYGQSPCLIFTKNISDAEKWALPSLNFLVANGICPNTPDNKGDYPAMICLRKKAYTVLDFLLKARLDLNFMDGTGNTPLHYCINNNHLVITEKLLKSGADPNFRDRARRTSMHWAVHKASETTDSSFEMIEALYSSKADINSIDNRGRSPLHYAFVKMGSPFETAHSDPIEIVSSFCGLPGIKVDIKDKWGSTPLAYAAQRGSNVSASFLLKRGANIESVNEDNNTPLGISILCGHANMATSLIQALADVTKPCRKIDTKEKLKREKEMDKEEGKIETEESDQSQNNGFGGGFGGFAKAPRKMLATNAKMFGFGFGVQANQEEEEEDASKAELGEYSLFRYALKRNWQGVAYLILEGGYKIMLAIQDAMSEKKLQYVYTLLLKREAGEYRITNEKQQNLWHTFGRDCSSVSQELFEKICKQFIQKAINPNSKDAENRTPMHYAAQSSFILLTTRLMELGLSLNDKDAEGDTPFSLYLKTKKALPHLVELRIFKDNGANLQEKFTLKGYGEVTPLIYLVMEGCKNQEILSFLLENGSSVNEQDSRGLTPIMQAVKQNSKKLVRTFLAHKELNVRVVDRDGKTPIHHCVNPIEFGSYENIEMLAVLAKYFDINAKDNQGHSAVYYANFQDSGVMKKQLLKLGADDVPLGMLKRAPTSVISTVDFAEPVPFEEDSEAFLEAMKAREDSDAIPTEEREKPDENASGTVEVLYHPVNGPYSLIMVKVDINHGFWSGNVFYRMQILHEKNRDIYIVFTRWGRVGDIGQFQQTPFAEQEEAIKEFSKIFKEKSGNEWSNKDSFVKIPKKYKLINVEKRVNAKNYLKSFDLKDKSLPATSLQKPIYKVVDAITDVKMYRDNLYSLGINEELMPLSSLSKATLTEAKGILDEIAILLEKINNKRKNTKEPEAMANAVLQLSEEISEKSSRFYELIPHTQFKTSAVPPISNVFLLGQKKEMVQNLLDYEVTTKIILGAIHKLKVIHPLDYCYRALHIRMIPLERENPEYSVIIKYIKNGWSGYNEKRVANIFAMERPGEAEKMNKFEKGHNRMLLWHGTKLMNVLSILYSGFKIAPPEAPVSGYMFGKGVYFADMFEKSFNYCQGNFGFFSGLQNSKKSMMCMFLCEVALGKMKELKEAEFITKLQSPFNSVKGVGKRGPNFKKSVVLSNGAKVPLGELIDYPTSDKETNPWARLQHNEYIVYDVSQIRIRYLVQIEDDRELDEF